MKESITKFDLEAAFKALDEIETPLAEKGIKANKPALTEIFSRKSKFDALFEEYYDIGNTEELTDAKEAREAEVAKAKLARIEKIVDLDAESPEDLLTSYVGKYIIQCPQCMTLFYKNPEDVEESEDDATTVNVNEVCQHCGNESGYTLVGKVGEATADEEENTNTDELESPEMTVPEEADTEEPIDDTEDSEEDFDLDGELEELDLDIEDDEEETNEALTTQHASATDLTEGLTESSELETSVADFEKLIKSPEFKKPISDNDARAMMHEFDSEKEAEDKEVKEAINKSAPLEEATKKTPEYKLTFEPINDIENDDLTNDLCDLVSSAKVKYCDAKKVAGKYRITILGSKEDLHAAKIVIENSGFFKAWLNNEKQLASSYDTSEEGETLEEGIFDKLKDKLSNVVDKLKSREAKANWVLANAREDYDNIKVSNKGQLVPDEKNQRFHTFIVIGFEKHYSNGKLITTAPSFNNKDLVIGKDGVQIKKKYEDADRIAKGWSLSQSRGPAFIYLAKDENDSKAIFLCEYFEGELEYDMLDKYFNIVKKDLQAGKLMAKGGMNQDDEEAAADEGSDLVSRLEQAPKETTKKAAPQAAKKEPPKITKVPSKGAPNYYDLPPDVYDYKDVLISQLRPGDTIYDPKWKIGGTATVLHGKVISCKKLNTRNASPSADMAVAVRLEDGQVKTLAFKSDQKVSIRIMEDLKAIMSGLENLQEDTLETLISNTLIENFEAIAGFKLTDCTYLNENFSVNGKILFTSGKVEDTSYTFSKAYSINDNNVAFYGLNESLATKKHFIMEGSVDTTTKTLCIESFKYQDIH
jgi:hypothetical protein